MRFAILALVGLLFVASDASATRPRLRRAPQLNFNGCNVQQFRAPPVQFVAPPVAIVAPVQQHHHAPQAVVLPVVDKHGNVLQFRSFSR